MMKRTYTEPDIAGLLVSAVWGRLTKSLDRCAGTVGPGYAEEIVAILMRGGVPGTAVKASMNHLTLNLANARYRIYRVPSGHPTGSFNILGNWCHIVDGVPPGRAAEFIDAFDALLPSLRERAAGLEEEWRDFVAKERREVKAKELVETGVGAILEERLAPLGIGYSFKVADGGVVDVRFWQRMEGSVKLPIEDLPGFFADGDAVRSAMAPVRGEQESILFRWPGQPGAGIIL